MKNLSILAFFLAFLPYSCQQKPFKQGEILYQNFCSNCHMDDGTGLEGVIPPLANADYLRDNQELLPCIIKNGMQGEIIVNGISYNAPMVGSEDVLSDFEITNIINYINHSWGNNYGYQKLKNTRKSIEDCK